MISGVFWNNVVSEVHKNEYPEMELEHMLADACAMQLVRKPKQFDLIVADNLFGDILSDEAAMLTGSMGMLPSASLGAVNPNTGKRNAMYEPVHGSAPDISGQGIANPIAEIASFAMALRYSFNLTEEAKMIEDSISAALDQGIRTPDIMQDGMKKVGTKEISDAIIAEMNSRT
jgi:3-isopropylmalate dehydrogenase